MVFTHLCQFKNTVTHSDPHISNGEALEFNKYVLGVNTNLRPQKAVSYLVADKLTLQQPNKAEFKQRETKAPLAIANENDQAVHKVARPTRHAVNGTSRCSARVKHQLASRSVRDRDALTNIYIGHAAKYEIAH